MAPGESQSRSRFFRISLGLALAVAATLLLPRGCVAIGDHVIHEHETTLRRIVQQEIPPDATADEIRAVLEKHHLKVDDHQVPSLEDRTLHEELYVRWNIPVIFFPNWCYAYGRFVLADNRLDHYQVGRGCPAI